MENSSLRTKGSSIRKFLTQEMVFQGFNDYKNKVWSDNYETETVYEQTAYEWGRAMACYCEVEKIYVHWTKVNTIPRVLTQAAQKAANKGYFLYNAS